MANMSKSDVLSAVAGSAGCTKADAEAVIEAFFAPPKLAMPLLGLVWVNSPARIEPLDRVATRRLGLLFK